MQNVGQNFETALVPESVAHKQVLFASQNLLPNSLNNLIHFSVKIL